MAKTITENIGNTEPVCPYCSSKLIKMPGAKTKCPSCDNPIYVRTRPSDRARILITETQIPIVEESWNLYHAQQEILRLMQESDYQEMEKALTKKWGFKPGFGDVSWNLWTKIQAEYAQEGNWRSYRSAFLSKAHGLELENRKDHSLDCYLLAFYLGVNGPNDSGLYAAVGQRVPFFDPSQPIDDLMVIRNVIEVVHLLKMEEASFKSYFLELAEKVGHTMRLPVSPNQAWNMLESSMKNFTQGSDK